MIDHRLVEAAEARGAIHREIVDIERLEPRSDHENRPPLAPRVWLTGSGRFGWPSQAGAAALEHAGPAANTTVSGFFRNRRPKAAIPGPKLAAADAIATTGPIRSARTSKRRAISLVDGCFKTARLSTILAIELRLELPRPPPRAVINHGGQTGKPENQFTCPPRKEKSPLHYGAGLRQDGRASRSAMICHGRWFGLCRHASDGDV